MNTKYSAEGRTRLLTRANANDLAARINDYWSKRGFKANARPMAWDVFGMERYVVRSDMVNGLPVERA